MSAILEMRNLSALIKGGSLSQRVGEIFARDLGIPLKQQNQQRGARCHGLEYGHVLMQVARKHALTETAQTQLSRALWKAC
ncbi:MAG: hypothetical protein ACM37Z_04535 [Deltaproteobacteria bacterium]